MLLVTVEDKYIHTLRHYIFDYINVNPIEIVNHLYAEYGDITAYISLYTNNVFYQPQNIWE